MGSKEFLTNNTAEVNCSVLFIEQIRIEDFVLPGVTQEKFFNTDLFDKMLVKEENSFALLIL